ncbi:MAG: XRE family transcriptional regulator [Rhodospirillales bacterium]|nr:XRE family transcriptional regulator [Rhodospirillales bacterium]
MMTKTVAGFDKPPRLSKTEKARLDGLMDESIARAAGDDADNPVLTQAELAEFEPIADAERIRRALNLTQEAFAQTFHIPIGTLRDWEQHRAEPDQAARNLLKVIAAAPDTVKDALSEFRERVEG